MTIWTPTGNYLLDWNLTGADGSATLSSAGTGPDVLVTVATPANTNGDEFTVKNGQLYSKDVCNETKSEITFGQAVTDVNFQLIDVDQGWDWDDKVTIRAYDADNNLVDVVFSDLKPGQVVTGNTIEGNHALDNPGVTVNIAGPITKLVIVHDNGSDHPVSGHIMVTDLGFNAAPVCPVEPDGIVQGTDGDDVIDINYTGDPHGDMVDNNDAILPGEGPNDDIILGFGGNDTIISGEGDDTIFAGTGDDTVYAGPGDDVVFGGEGDDVIHGEAGDDVIFGDEGNDILHGGDGDDFLHGGDGDDELYGGDGDDILIGGAGNDLLDGGTGVNQLFGGDDRDTFVNVGVEDYVDGGEGGDDYDTLDLRGSAPVNGGLKVTYTSPDKEDGFVTFFDEDDNSLGTMNFYNIEKVVPCFTPGTRIATPKGEKLVQELKAGDRVITRDNGIQEIRWIGAKPMDWKAVATNPHLNPVLIRAGALGNGLPERDMMVSPNHRVLVANDRTALYFDEREVLAAAKHLVDNRGIQVVEPAGVTYIHFMFDHHEVVLSDGAWTESFQPGDYSLKGIGNAQRQELFELFPELETSAGIEDYAAARRILKKHEARMLVGE